MIDRIHPFFIILALFSIAFPVARLLSAREAKRDGAPGAPGALRTMSVRECNRVGCVYESFSCTLSDCYVLVRNPK